MAVSLFRMEAVEFQRTRAWAGATATPSFPSWLLTTFFTGAVVLAITFLSLGTYARKATVTGYLAPIGGVAKVMPPAPGVVTEVYVAEGQDVEAGQPLLAVRSGRHGSEGQEVDRAIVANLQVKRNALAQRIDIEQRAAELQQQSLTDEISGRRAEITALAQSLDAQKARLQVAHDLVETVKPTVSQGYTSMTEFRRRQDTELAQRQAMTDLQRQIATKAVEVREKERSLAEMQVKSEDNFSVLRSAVADADAVLAQAAGKDGYSVTAPVAGRVTSLQVWVGMDAEITLPFLAIIPRDAQLQATLLVPAGAAGFIARGQTVHFEFTPYPGQRFGFYDGTITAVSDTLLKPAEMAGPIVVTDPSYRVTARLDRQTVTAYGAEVPLKPDTPVKAAIIIDRHSLIGWLMQPVLASRRQI
jgi:membrane fusion protein